MKFAFAAALLAASSIAVETESIGYGSYGYNGLSGLSHVKSAILAAPASYSYATHYNGCGHHTDSYTDSCSDSYSSNDYSSSDYGYGYRSHPVRSYRSTYGLKW